MPRKQKQKTPVSERTEPFLQSHLDSFKKDLVGLEARIARNEDSKSKMTELHQHAHHLDMLIHNFSLELERRQAGKSGSPRLVPRFAVATG